MTRQEIFEKLSEVFSDVFDEELTVTDATTSADIADWDSLTHITLISEVEDTFGMKFAMKDVLGMKNVGEMADIIEKNVLYTQKVGIWLGFFLRCVFIRISSPDTGRLLFSSQTLPQRLSDVRLPAVLCLGRAEVRFYHDSFHPDELRLWSAGGETGG